MSGVAGIVSLTPMDQAAERDLRLMLETMTVDGGDVRVVRAAGGRIAVGRVGSGPDADQVASPAGAELPAAMMVGELHNDHAQQAPSHAAWLLDQYRSASSPDFAAALNGSFAAAVIDDQAAAVALVTDHMGSIPLYTRTERGVLYFATEVKALVAPPHLPCEPDDAGVLSMLTCKQLIGDRTLIEGVRALGPACVFRAEPGKTRRDTYWRFEIDDDPRDEGEAVNVERMIDRLGRAVERCTRSGRTGILLSGGSDSRTIVSFLGDVRKLSAVTYTGRDPDQRHPVGDVAVAAELAEMVGLEHHVVQYDGGEVLAAMRRSVCDADGEAGFIEQSIWGRLRHEFGYEYVIIGDECLGLTAGRIHESQVLDCVAVRALRDVRTLWPYVRSDRFDELADLSDRSCRELQAPWLGRPPVNQVDELWHRQGMGRWFNPKRRMLARYGLIARRPLLDRDVLDLIRAVPYRYRCGKRLARKAAARANSDVVALPLARSSETTDYRGDLRRMETDGGRFSAFLFDDNPLLRRYLDEETVRHLVARVTAEPSAPSKQRRRGLGDMLPPRLRAWLVGRARRYLGIKAPVLTSPTDQLIRIALLGECLRHVRRRCGTA